jgi:hypothetical protein
MTSLAFASFREIRAAYAKPMRPHPSMPGHLFPSEKAMKQVLGGLSIFTLLMTLPQIVAIWATLVLDGAVVIGALIYG